LTKSARGCETCTVQSNLPATVRQDEFLTLKNRPIQEKQWTMQTVIEPLEFENR